MDDWRAGAALRALRLRRRWRQMDVARAAGVSQQAVSLIERGHLGKLSVDSVRRVFAAVDAGFEADVRWRGGELDRLLDERHAAVVGTVAGDLRAFGWDVALEVTFSSYGERGSIDLLADHAATGTLLVVEAKTEIVSVEELLRRLDVKVRLAPALGRTKFGRSPGPVSRLVVVLDTSTARRRVDRQAAALDLAFPARGPAVKRWLRRPTGP
ncbi:MAG TPA: helix-turn-helix domain-containing protein, partial [Candidatus Saccharimonadales bacterium]|nr:helix-turn-helix domain-containing protein [Candidatus Saccharimonadales bacterium]